MTSRPARPSRGALARAAAYLPWAALLPGALVAHGLLGQGGGAAAFVLAVTGLLGLLQTLAREERPTAGHPHLADEPAGTQGPGPRKPGPRNPGPEAPRVPGLGPQPAAIRAAWRDAPREVPWTRAAAGAGAKETAGKEREMGDLRGSNP